MFAYLTMNEDVSEKKGVKEEEVEDEIRRSVINSQINECEMINLDT